MGIKLDTSRFQNWFQINLSGSLEEKKFLRDFPLVKFATEMGRKGKISRLFSFLGANIQNKENLKHMITKNCICLCFAKL